jgi:hypothetical protein
VSYGFAQCGINQNMNVSNSSITLSALITEIFIVLFQVLHGCQLCFISHFREEDDA